MERVIITGDLAKLTPEERVTYYMRVCESLGLNPLTKPFDYIVLNNKLTLYPNKDCAAQLRSIQSVSVDDIDIQVVGEAYVVKVKGHNREGRQDADMGYVSIVGMRGNDIGNAMKKAVTQGKRRLTLSLVGLGWLDETEIEQIPNVVRPDVDADGVIHTPTLAERAASRAAEVKPTVTLTQTNAQADVATVADATVIEGEATEVQPGMTLATFMLLKGERGVQFGAEFTAACNELYPGLAWPKFEDAHRYALARKLGMVEPA
jgi:hypothetical protein